MQQLSPTLLGLFFGGASPTCGAGHRGGARLGILPGPCPLRSGSVVISPVFGMQPASLDRSPGVGHRASDQALEVCSYMMCQCFPHACCL